MKTLKLLAVIGLITAVASAAGAIQYRPGFEGYTGLVKWNIVNWDMGPIYSPLDPTLATGNPVIGAANLDALLQFPAAGTIGAEDNWGIFRVQEILTDDGFNNTLWQSGDQSKELVGIFYGGIDNAVVLNLNTGEQTIQSSGWSFAMFEQNFGTLTNALIGAGSAGRVGAAQFEGVGVDGAGVQYAHATTILTGVSTTGVTPIAGSPAGSAHVLALFTPDTTGTTGTGKSTIYFDIQGGTWQYAPPFGYEWTGALPLFPSSPNGDLQLQATATPNPQFPGGPVVGDWTVTTDDPVRGYAVVPEPATMGLVALSVSGLAGYIRRRRA